MIASDGLTEGQRDFLRGLPLYPWVIWSRRLFVGAFVFMFTVAVTGGGNGTLVLAGMLLLIPFALVNSVASSLALSQMTKLLGVRGWKAQMRLSRAIRQIIDRDAFLPSRS